MSDIKTIDLKPCPFCGHIKALFVSSFNDIADIDNSGDGYGVCCNYKMGGCGATSGIRATRQDALRVWNMRQVKGVRDE